jgi:hypothetical protein
MLTLILGPVPPYLADALIAVGWGVGQASNDAVRGNPATLGLEARPGGVFPVIHLDLSLWETEMKRLSGSFSLR